MKRKRVTVAAAAVLIAIFVSDVSKTEDQKTIEYRYEVDQGDTVYDVATMVATPEDDINKLSWQICRDNHIKNGLIQPGQVLRIRIPVYSSI